MCVLYIHRDGSGRLDFIQSLLHGFKFVEALSLDFLLTPSEIIKQHIVYRYHAIRGKVDALQHRLREGNERGKTKNPPMLLAIKRTPARGGGGGGSNAAAGQQHFASSDAAYPPLYAAASAASSPVRTQHYSQQQQQQYHPSASPPPSTFGSSAGRSPAPSASFGSGATHSSGLKRGK